MDNGIAGAAAMPRPMPLPTRPAVADSLSQDRDRPQNNATRPDPENPSTTPAQPDPVPEPVSTQAPSGETRNPFVDQLQGMAEQMTERVQSQGRSLEFVVNGQEGEDVVVLIRSSDTGEVVRTIPPEELANLSQQVRNGGLNTVDARV
ncbi:flagellar protein FlaG [Wenzhouxiangella limi]|uniref:Flagellar protein FlaG n=1 Tax=Wenzhouxiangella limi TaxID=2707351 RepID=A0A845VIV9_9GAMM|nr:flagellar protein FlaG [Wenzhouxiangella limi]NDY97109.1 flagellar protein FlaG [Wenzhouxiangella limi]